MEGNIFKNWIKNSLKRQQINKKQAVLDGINELFPEIEISNIEELENIDFPECTEDQFKEINLILEKTYPKYTPYYLYRFEFKDGQNKDSLFSEIQRQKRECFNEEGCDINNKFRIKKIENTMSGNNICIKISIEEYQVNINYRGEEERGQIKNREDINIYIYSSESNIYINTGKESLANVILKFYLLNNFGEIINITLLKVSNSILTNIAVENATDDKVTVFMLELITNKLRESPYNVNNYIKVGISNRNDSNIKSITVRGKDLLKEKEVADRLNSGFTLKNAELEIAYLDTNTQTVYMACVSITFQSTIKIVITKGDNMEKNNKILKKIFDEANELLTENVEVSSIMDKYFSTVVSQRAIQKMSFINNVEAEVKKDSMISELWDKIKVILENLY